MTSFVKAMRDTIGKIKLYVHFIRLSKDISIIISVYTKNLQSLCQIFNLKNCVKE